MTEARVVLLLSLFFFNAGISQQKSEEFRSWTSTNGTKIDAALVSSSGDRLKLKTRDGRLISVRLNQISPADRKWLADTQARTTPANLTDDHLDRLSKLLGNSLKSDLTDDERDEVEKLFTALLPQKGADGEEVEWEVRFPKSGTPIAERDSALISADLNQKGSDERLMWFHVVYHKQKPDFFGNDRVGSYGAMRMENRHAFVLIGKTEVRGIADHESYRNDKKIDAMIEAINLKAIRKL